MKSVVYDIKGSKLAEKVNLDDNIFGLTRINHQVLKDAYLSYLANRRANYAVTKTRGLVSGGGKKPWRQKGTGRARFGSSRNPIWRKGGVVFGPTGQENYSRKINKKVKNLATRTALSQAVIDKKIVILNNLNFKKPNTKQAVKLINQLKLSDNILLVVDQYLDNVVLSFRNIKNLKMITVKHLNTFNILNADHILIEQSSLKTLESWLIKNDRKVTDED